MDCTCLVNRKYRLKRDDIPEFLVEPDILFDAPEGDCRRMLAFSAARAAEKLFRSGSCFMVFPVIGLLRDRRNCIGKD